MNSDSNGPEIPLKSPSADPPGVIFRFEGYELELSRWQLRWQDDVLPVHRKSFDLLVYLLRKRPAVVTKDELLSALWPGQFVEENNLAQQISTLRKALSRHGSAHHIIETVPGRGYRFASEVEEVRVLSAAAAAPSSGFVLSAEQSITRITVEEEALETEATAAVAQPASAVSGPRRRTMTRPLIWVTTVLVVLAVASWLLWNWWQDRDGGPPVQVVLANVQGGTGDAALDQALQDAVRYDLSQSPFVTVVSPSSVNKTLRNMRRDPSQPLAPATANEVCERTNSQAVMRTVLARAGSHFLLTGDVTSCVNGSILTSATAEVNRTEDLRLAINDLIGRLRKHLGESRRSVARFTTPRSSLETASLDALEAASQAGVLGRQGKFTEAIALYKQAIAYDPGFAQAYYDLSAAYTSTEQEAGARASIQKAYELRSTVSPFFQLAIASRYTHLVTRDLYEAERQAALWTQLYPNYALAWNTLCNVRKDLGNHTEAVQAARNAFKLRPDTSPLINAYAQEQMRTGDANGARKSCQLAMSLNSDDDFPHMLLARIAFSQNDATLANQQLEWLAAHPDSPTLLSAEAEISIAQGRFKEGKDYLARFAAVSLKEGDRTAGAAVTKQIAREMIIAGDPEEGGAIFRRESLDEDSPEDVLTLAILGDPHRAETLFQRQATKFPQDTLLNSWYGPMIEGWRELASGRPQDAVAALTRPGVIDKRDAELRLLRGRAYLANKQWKEARVEFQQIVSHPELDHTAAFTVAWLDLARTLATENNRSAASDAYRRFLLFWAHADTNAALPQAAQHELSAL